MSFATDDTKLFKTRVESIYTLISFVSGCENKLECKFTAQRIQTHGPKNHFTCTALLSSKELVRTVIFFFKLKILGSVYKLGFELPAFHMSQYEQSGAHSDSAIQH